MILVAYKRVEGTRAELEATARHAFPSLKNDDYLGEILARKNDNSACDSCTALLLLSHLLRELGIDVEQLSLRRSQNGKPFFESGDIEFSISHSRGIVAVALSDLGAIGIDVEAAKMTSDRAKMLSERYFNSSASADEFLRRWVRAEAYVKMADVTLAEGIKEKIPDNVNFRDFEIYGFPASIAFRGDQTVRIIEM